MKKLVLLFSVLSIFLIPSFSFAYDFPDDSFAFNYPYYVLLDNGWWFGSDMPFKIDSNKTTLYANPQATSYYGDKYDSLFNFVGQITVPSAYGPIIPVSANSDILYKDSSDVFFSPPPAPLILAAEELPPVVAQHGGIVLSVALMGFGLLLVVSLIPRLVKRFLY